MTTVAASNAGLGELAQEQRDHGLAVDRQHRLGVVLGQWPQPCSEAGGDHHGVQGHARSERSATKPRSRAVRPRPCRIARSRARSSLWASRRSLGTRLRRPEACLGKRSGKPLTVCTELPSHELVQLSGCRARPNLDTLVDEEVGELAPSRTGEPPRIARQIPKPAADDLRSSDCTCDDKARQQQQPQRRRPAVVCGCSARALPLFQPFLLQEALELARAASRSDAVRPAEGIGRIACVESCRRGAVIPGQRPPARGGVERQPAVAGEPRLDPGVGVVVGHDPAVAIALAAREAARDARRNAEEPEHQCHRAGEVLAVAALALGDEVGERRQAAGAGGDSS